VFAQPWDYAKAGSLMANKPFSRIEEVVAKAAREGCHMLVIAPEWPGPQYPCWASLCSLCPNRWCLPQDSPIYLRGGSDIMPAPKWRCRDVPAVPAPSISRGRAPPAGGTPGPGPGRATHGGPPP